MEWKGIFQSGGIICIGFGVSGVTKWCRGEGAWPVTRNSVSRIETASVIVILLFGMFSQHLLIMSQIRSESSGSSGRGGRDPSIIEYIAAVSLRLENTRRRAKTCNQR